MAQTYQTVEEQAPQGQENEIVDLPAPIDLQAVDLEETKQEAPKTPAYPVFSLEMNDLDLFKRIVKTANTLIEELTFEVWPGGLTSVFMDPSHVGLLQIAICKADFRTFTCDTPGRFTLRVEDFLKVLERGKEGCLRISSAGSENIKVEFAAGRTKSYELHKIESSESKCPLPKIDTRAMFSISRVDLDEIIKDLSVSSSHITIAADQQSVYFSGKGDTGKFDTEMNFDNGLLGLRVDLSPQSTTQKKLDANGKVVCNSYGAPEYETVILSVDRIQSTYSIEYLDKVLKALKPNSVIIDFGTKMPLRMTYSPHQGESFVSFYLAPSVQE